ncbi:MAG: FMN-dependent NADH-azoreductase [Cytophagales bacterium]|nr:FMN-dependent NADH-azoreductase [Armatimonadota bacterium]
MTKILQIDFSPRSAERSVSRQLTHQFVEEWKTAHPTEDVTVTHRDLQNPSLPYVTEEWIAAAFSAPDQHGPELQKAIALSNELVDELFAHDLYVFGVPMYNFGVPAIFKAYIDQVSRAGRTFSFEPPATLKGLLTGKKLVVLSARGGSGFGPGQLLEKLNHQDPYIRTISGFLGITDVTFIHSENLNGGEDVRSQSLAAASAEIKEAVASR